MASRLTADELLAEARRGLSRLEPVEAASAIAAANLRRLGFERATDLAGGFRAWRAAGLPVERRARR